MHLVGFIIRIFHDARSPEREIRTLMLLEMSILYFQYRNPILYKEEFKISLPSDYLWYSFFSVTIFMHKYLLIVNGIDMSTVLF